MQAALYGDLATLKRRVQQEQREGDLDEGRVRDLAHAVAAREVRSAQGPLGAARLRQARPCAPALSRELEDRAARGDDGAAEAALSLLEIGGLDRRQAVERYAEASSGAFRAVAARAAVAPGLGPLRRRFFVDPDERVRRAALRAAAEARAAADLEALLEAGRLDPDPVSRGLAIRAAGGIGGARAASALDDLWPRATPHLRVAIVDAWAVTATYRSGGAERLLRTVETERGLPAIAAAGALVRHGHPHASVAEALILRGIQHGSAAERHAAIALVRPEQPEARQALERAARDDDPQIRVQALERLTGVPGARARAIAALEKLSAGDTPSALNARAALAKAGVSRVAPALERDLRAKSAWQRLRGALALVELDRYTSAATALADDDADVRLGLSCSIIAGR